MNYKKKLQIANNYLREIIGAEWDDLPDINSLHDCKDKESIIDACKERIGDDFEFDFD